MTATQTQRQARREAAFRREDYRCVLCRRKGWDRDGAGPIHDDEVCPLDVHYVRLRDSGQAINAETVLCDYCRGCAEEWQLRRRGLSSSYAPMAILSRMSPVPSPPVSSAVAPASAAEFVPAEVRQAKAAFEKAFKVAVAADEAHDHAELGFYESNGASDMQATAAVAVAKRRAGRLLEESRQAYARACIRWVDSLIEGDRPCEAASGM